MFEWWYELSQWPCCFQALYTSYIPHCVLCRVVLWQKAGTWEWLGCAYWWPGNKITQADIHACSICAIAKSTLVPLQTRFFCPSVFCSMCQTALVLTTVGFVHEVRLILENCCRCIWNILYHSTCTGSLVILLPWCCWIARYWN